MRKHLWLLGLLSLISGCATELAGDSADLEKVEYPTGIVFHPNGKYAYVVGSNFDLDYRSTDGGAVYVVDIENNKILDTSKRMGSFGTNIVLSDDAKHGYTITRDDNALVWFEISDDGSRIFCPKADEDSNSLLDCRVIVDDNPTHIAITRSYRETTTTDAQGNEVKQRVDFDLLMIAQLRDAGVTAVTVIEDENGDLNFSKESAALVMTASEVQWIGGERFAVTGRAALNQLLIVSPAIDKDGKVLGIYAKEAINIPNARASYQGRGMTLTPDKQNLFLINQYPDSLLKINITGISHNDIATDRAQVTGMMMLPYDMSKIAWVGNNDEGMLYLTCVSKDAIYVVDPRKMEIQDVIQVGKGPYELYQEDTTLYVLNFLDNTIWALDTTDPAKPVVINKYLTNDESVSEHQGQ